MVQKGRLEGGHKDLLEFRSQKSDFKTLCLLRELEFSVKGSHGNKAMQISNPEKYVGFPLFSAKYKAVHPLGVKLWELVGNHYWKAVELR